MLCLGLALSGVLSSRVPRRARKCPWRTGRRLTQSLLCFKSLQLLVFVGWCYIYGNGSVWPASSSLLPPLTGLLLIAIGQVFNLGVFVQLGNKGVFYGNRFGFEIPWNESFPFSVLKHPQYVGAVLSIWGFFIAMRFPRPDWYVLPCLETI